MLDRNPRQVDGRSLPRLPKTWGSPTMAPHCADETNTTSPSRCAASGDEGSGRADRRAAIGDLVTVNGVRVAVDDGSWGLVRASSNKPELVVVVESPASEARMRAMFEAVDTVMRETPSVGAYNQTI